MRISKFLSSLALAAAISGITLIAFGAQASPLIVNGDFETGDFSGWTTGPNSFPQFIVPGPSVFVHSGFDAAAIAGFASDPDTLSQLVSDTNGQSYSLSFWRNQAEFGGPITLTVSWNGTQVFSEDLTGSNTGLLSGYQQFTVNVLGSGSDLLVFTSANDIANTYLDDVTLTPTAATPLPGALPLLASGLGAMGLLGWRRKKKSAALAA